MKYLFVMSILGMSVAQAGPISANPFPISKEAKALPVIDINVARADNACANFAAAMISKTEHEYADQLSAWRDSCSTHPTRVTCEDTLDTVKTVRGNNMGLVCGQRKAGEEASEVVAIR
jgi:hypothetical protein